MKKLLFFIFLLTIISVSLYFPVFLDPKIGKNLALTRKDQALYISAALALKTLSFLSKGGEFIVHHSANGTQRENELHLLTEICDTAAGIVFAPKKKNHAPSKKISSEHRSWYKNQFHLVQIPVLSDEDEKLLKFLERRWLAKSTGFYSSIAHWVCPLFGIDLQVHPESCSSYARAPNIKESITYKKDVENWKKNWEYPKSFPLILTRPSSLHEYLSSYYLLKKEDSLDKLEEYIAQNICNPSKIIVDLTSRLPIERKENHKNWLSSLYAIEDSITKIAQKYQLSANRFIFIHQIQKDDLGGICILPIRKQSQKQMVTDYEYLLRWVSSFGLSSNRIELDRAFPTSLEWHRPSNAYPLVKRMVAKEQLIDEFRYFEQSWMCSHPQKKIMVLGTLKALQGFIDQISEKKWEEILLSPTRCSIASLSFQNIIDELHSLTEEKDSTLFFQTACHVEQIHANLSSLLEVFNLYNEKDFPPIFAKSLTAIPGGLKPLTSYTLHASGMNSLAGIFNACKHFTHEPIRMIYGENTYYETIHAAEAVGQAVSVEEAKTQDWEKVDLLIAQFNPVLKRTDHPVLLYQVEPIHEMIRKSLVSREKPLVVAIDATLDYINSFHLEKLLTEFEKEIKEGRVLILCYKSGLKFDLFGMDNYCGAPFFMIHSKDTHWDPFKRLLNDPVLLTDSLSINWFCLAYEYCTDYLELYRAQIFQNTRELIEKLPYRLLSSRSTYRVVPVKGDVDTSFIDIKVSGSFHKKKAAALVGGLLYLSCMQNGHPVFYRISLGFYHPNFTMIFGPDCSTIRLTLGLDPAQIDVIVRSLEKIDTLNE